MPTEVYEEALSIDIDVLEALPLAPDPERPRSPSYPYPMLAKAGRRQEIRLRVLTLENPYLRVQIAPDLGGRVLRIWDKRTERDILPYSENLKIVGKGTRGAELCSGLTWNTFHRDRKNAMGPVDWTVIEAADDDSPGGLWLFEIDAPSGIGVHVGISLPPNVAQIELEMRCVNRRLESAAYAPCFEAFVGQGKAWSVGVAAAFDAGGSGIYLTEQGVPCDGVAYHDGALSIHRFHHSESHRLAPMQTDTWGIRLVPISGLNQISAAGPGAALELDQSSIRIQSSAVSLGSRVLILAASGETLKAEVDLYPERLAELDLAGVHQPEVISVMNSEDQELVRWDRGERRSIHEERTPRLDDAPKGDFERAVEDLYRFNADPRRLLRQTFEPATRPGAYVAIGAVKAQSRDWRAAAEAFESALAFEAENPVVWWLKAIVERRIAVREEEPELLNAHYLAPLDPLLRAAAFLAQPTHAKEATTLLAPMADNPDAMVEVACLLGLCGLNEELSKWCDECLRHREIPMLRYLLADALVAASRMEVEAAQHIQAAAKTPVNPPYPWRPMEFAVLRRLHARFPSDERIKDLLGFAT